MSPFTSHVTFESITKSCRWKTKCDNITLNGQIIVINKETTLLPFILLLQKMLSPS